MVPRELLSEGAIQSRIVELAAEIRRDAGDSELLLICVLKGSFIFLADLCRHLGDNVKVDFLQVSSYGDGVKSSGIVQIIKDIDQTIEGKNVLVVEDIVDTGATLSHLRELLQVRRPASLKVVALLNKQDARRVPVQVEYVGFDIPDQFVVGYGLDVGERFRNLPYVAVLQEELSSTLSQ